MRRASLVAVLVLSFLLPLAIASQGKDRTVYFVTTKTYHLYQDCQHLKNSKKTPETSTFGKESMGKRSFCKTCNSRFNKEKPAATPKMGSD